MIPNASQLWMLPTNRIISIVFLNLFYGGFLFKDSVTLLLNWGFQSHRMQVFQRTILLTQLNATLRTHSRAAQS